jgi:hypothetical protein
MLTKITITACMVIILVGCSDHGHSHNDNSHDHTPSKHDNIN